MVSRQDQEAPYYLLYSKRKDVLRFMEICLAVQGIMIWALGYLS